MRNKKIGVLAVSGALGLTVLGGTVAVAGSDDALPGKGESVTLPSSSADTSSVQNRTATTTGSSPDRAGDSSAPSAPSAQSAQSAPSAPSAQSAQSAPSAPSAESAPSALSASSAPSADSAD